MAAALPSVYDGHSLANNNFSQNTYVVVVSLASSSKFINSDQSSSKIFTSFAICHFLKGLGH